MTDVKNWDESGFAPSRRSAINRLREGVDDPILKGGMACDIKEESIPEYIFGGCEVVLNNANNSWIVLGRDRSAGLTSGYGGLGHSKCGMIDLVVGRMHGKTSPLDVDDEGEKIFLNPQFVPYISKDPGVPGPGHYGDAARVYISQKTDVDKNFNLTSGKVLNSEGKSAVAIKADAVRIIANEGIKLVTAPDKVNSWGVPTTVVAGIDLIAGNSEGATKYAEDSLQPLVKGENLVDCLRGIVSKIEELNRTVQGIVGESIKVNKIVAKHIHVTPTGPTTGNSCNTPLLSANLRDLGVSMKSLENNNVNCYNIKRNYLSKKGGQWICSRYNNAN